MKTFLCVLVLFCPLTVLASDWQPLGSPRPDGTGSFIDLDNITPLHLEEYPRSALFSVSVLTNYRRARLGALSARDTYRVDCATRSVGLAAGETYPEGDAQGKPLASFVPRTVPLLPASPGTLAESLIQEVCSKTTP